MEQSSKPEARAQLKNLRMSAQKVRLVVDQVRGMPVDQALAVLRFSTKRAALPVAKTIKSAAANANDTLGLDQSDLVVSRIWADEGTTMKRARFGARGRYKPLLKRSSHVTVVVTER
jgi:large subunit ribosomal protein L22